MQGRADETERPLVWPGVTVGGVSLKWNPESLSGICARREVMVDFRVAMPHGCASRSSGFELSMSGAVKAGHALQGVAKSAYVQSVSGSGAETAAV